MTGIIFSFLAVFALALVTVALGSPPDGFALVWTGYGVQTNALAAVVAVGAHLVLAALIYRLWQGLAWGTARPLQTVPGPSVDALSPLPHREKPDVALIGLRGLTVRAAERGDMGTARELARRGLADKPGTGWLQDLLDSPIAATSKT